MSLDFVMPASRMSLDYGWTSKSNRNRHVLTKAFTANLPASLAFGFFQIQNSPTRRAKNGTANVSTKTLAIKMTTSSSGHIAYALHAAPAILRQIREIRWRVHT